MVFHVILTATIFGRKLNSAKWTARIGAYYILTALVLSTIVYHIASLVF